MLVSVFHHGKHGLSIILHLILTDISYLNFLIYLIFFSQIIYILEKLIEIMKEGFIFSGFLMKQSCEQGRIQGGAGGHSPPPEF